MTEKGQPLPYPLDACAGCRDLTEQLAALRQELEDVPTLRGDLEMLMTQLKERDSIIDQLRQRVEELERDQHKPTVTYWMNQFTLMQQEAKKRFDDWFVLRQQVDDLTAKCEKLEQIQVIDKNNNDEYREMRAANLAVIHALTAKLAALQLHWTSEKPTVPGWYWRRYNSSGVLIIEIVKIVSSGSKLVVRDFGGVIDFLLGEWAGPLVPPEE
jgi:hypothetical protein